MKALVVYYSYEGNCEFVAARIGAALGADTLRLETRDDRKRTGFSKYLWGGRQVLSRAMPELKPYAADISGQDLVVLGTPVWAGSPAPALRTFLAETPIRGKRVALFVCHGGGKGRAMEKLRAELAGNEIAGEIDFLNPLGGNAEEMAERIARWAGTLA